MNLKHIFLGRGTNFKELYAAFLKPEHKRVDYNLNRSSRKYR